MSIFGKYHYLLQFVQNGQEILPQRYGNQIQIEKFDKQLYRIQMMNHPLYGNNDLRKKIEDYSYGLKDVIGRGFSSVVYRGTNDKTKEKVAIKVIDIRAIQGKPQKRMLEGQIEALKKLNHTNIMKCYDIFSTANNCYIITEFCNEGDLENLLKKREKLPEEEALPILREFLMGFMHIAESGFLHRDLKPANILLKDKVVKIADFGFAKRVTTNTKQTVNVGSPLYMSPEALQNNIYSIKNDIWSVGVIFYEILHGKAPWTCSNQKQLIEEINKNNIYLLKNLSEDLKDFIRRCLAPDEGKRITVKEMSNHPFMSRIMADFVPSLKKIVSNNQNQEQQVQPLDNVPSNKPKNIHHRPNNVKSATAEQQFLCQLNWMRFLNKFNLMFPDVVQSGRYTLGLRFIVVKQLLSQLLCLEKCLTGENTFNIEGWKEYITTCEIKQKFIKSIEDYKKKYESYFQKLKEWIPIVGKDKKLSNIVDMNFQRSQFLNVLGLSFALEECKNVWQGIQKEKSSNPDNQLQGKTHSEAMRLDFTMTYYQLNCLLTDNFYDLQAFTQHSKLQLINEYKPANLLVSNLSDIEHKLRSLEMVR